MPRFEVRLETKQSVESSFITANDLDDARKIVHAINENNQNGRTKVVLSADETESGVRDELHQ